MKTDFPALIIDTGKVESNIERMLSKASKSKAVLRPHFKTHQSARTGEIFRKKGVEKITVSSVQMAEYFAKYGWNDITIAFPLNLLEIEKTDNLAGKIKLNILLDSPFVASEIAKNTKNNIGVFIEIDTGYHRTGLLPGQENEIEKITDIISNTKNLNFKGFLTHAGHTYNANGKEKIIEILNDAKQKMTALKNKWQQRFPDIIVSYGDTPSCSIADNCNGFDEIRPGNFVYYDVMQYHLGSCNLSDIAVSVAAPVTGIYKNRSEIAVYGGAVHLSKEFIAGDNNFSIFGYIVKYNGNFCWNEPLNGAWVKSISQEHGIVHMPANELGKIKQGDVIGILPVHSCLTANLLNKKFFIPSNEPNISPGRHQTTRKNLIK